METIQTPIRDTAWERELSIAERLCHSGYRRLNQERDRLLIRNYTGDTFEVSWDGKDIKNLVSLCITADPALIQPRGYIEKRGRYIVLRQA